MLVSVISIFTLFFVDLFIHRLFFLSTFFSIGCFFSRPFFHRPFFPGYFFPGFFFLGYFFLDSKKIARITSTSPTIWGNPLILRSWCLITFNNFFLCMLSTQDIPKTKVSRYTQLIFSNINVTSITTYNPRAPGIGLEVRETKRKKEKKKMPGLRLGFEPRPGQLDDGSMPLNTHRHRGNSRRVLNCENRP